jgi:hypothetical protein
MSFADVFVLGGGVLVLLLIFALVRQSRRHSYRLRDLTDLSSGIDPDWERARRTMHQAETMHQPEKPPEERSS